MKKLILISFVLLGFAAGAYAQASASDVASVSATILAPIAIEKTVDMNFGNIATSVAGGDVVLSPAGSRTPTGVVLPPTTGTVTAASFDVTGEPSFGFTITLPSADVTIVSGTDDMIVNAFTSNPSTPTFLDGSGAKTVTVGATLTIEAGQPAGTYTTTTPFTVEVNYN